MAKGPCKNCDKRHVACHSECEEYIAYRKEADRVNKKRREFLQARVPVSYTAHKGACESMRKFYKEKYIKEEK